jgi:hypothetical protein
MKKGDRGIADRRHFFKRHQASRGRQHLPRRGNRCGSLRWLLLLAVITLQQRGGCG